MQCCDITLPWNDLLMLYIAHILYNLLYKVTALNPEFKIELMN